MSDKDIITPIIQNTGGGPYVVANLWLRNFHYRDGWRFELSSNPPGTTGWDRPTLIVSANVKDSTGMFVVQPGDTFTVTHSIDLPPCDPYNEQDFMRAVLEVCVMIETHEAMEFALYKGERIVNPHQAGGVVLYHLPPRVRSGGWPLDYMKVNFP